LSKRLRLFYPYPAAIVQRITTTLAPDESLERAADLMADAAVGLLPVTSPDARLLGIVKRRDVLNAYTALPRAPHVKRRYTCGARSVQCCEHDERTT
jgi:CBS domain-containing protein